MKTSEDRPPFNLVRSSSRDNKVSCETLSHADWFSHPKFEGREHFLYDADDIYWDAADPDLDLELQRDLDSRNVGKSFPAAHLFGCFPKSSSYFPPRTIMSPGKEGKRGVTDNAGRPRTHPSPIPHSGGIPHSGTIPHSGPIKLNTGPIISHSGNLKGQAKDFSWPSIIPADFLGKKKPPGYDEQEPTSPEVTCLGHVRIKHNGRRNFPSSGDTKQMCDWKCNFLRKMKSFGGVTEKGGKQRGAKDQAKHTLSRVDLEEKLGSSYTVETEQTEVDMAGKFLESEQNRGERGTSLSDYVAQTTLENGSAGASHDGDSEAKFVPQVPPPNSLLLMRGSRNLERESQKTECSEAPGVPLITQSPSVHRQVSLPKPPPEASIWKRRNACQPTALDIRIPIKLEIKQPCTK